LESELKDATEDWLSIGDRISLLEDQRQSAYRKRAIAERALENARAANGKGQPQPPESGVADTKNV